MPLRFSQVAPRLLRETKYGIPRLRWRTNRNRQRMNASAILNHPISTLVGTDTFFAVPASVLIARSHYSRHRHRKFFALDLDCAHRNLPGPEQAMDKAPAAIAP